MESIKLGNGKLMILLDARDAAAIRQKYPVYDIESFVDSLIPGMRALGFIKSGCTLFVEYYPDVNGGGQLFISAENKRKKKTYRVSDTRPGGAMKYIKEESFDASHINGAKKDNGAVFLYEFNDFESLLGACKALGGAKRHDASLLFSDDGTVCLSLKDASPIPGEFGGVIMEENSSFALRERYRVIVKDAVSALAGFAI